MSNFCVKIRVRYAECDAQKVVFNARYGDYVDIAVTEYMRVVAGGFQALFEQGIDTQVVRLLTEWKSSAIFDDVIAMQIETEKVGNTSFALKIVMTDAKTDRLIATNEIVYVVVDNINYQKMAIPDFMRDALNTGAPNLTIDFSGNKN